MKEYDSILKEELVYQDPVWKRHKYSKYVMIYVVLMILILGISYVVYYQVVLSPVGVLGNDMKILLDKYQNIYRNFLPSKVLDGNGVEGTITLNSEAVYNYGLVHNQKESQFEITNADTYLIWDMRKNQSSLGMFGEEEQVVIRDEGASSTDIRKNIEKYFSKNFLKKMYWEKNRPVVEFGFSFQGKDINTLLDRQVLEDQYDILVTLKNHAITNSMIYMKIVIYNKTRDERRVLEYVDGEFIYVNSMGERYRFTYASKGNDFDLRVYKENVLYSILLGHEIEDDYTYTYQIIDEIYTIVLKVSLEEGGYLYTLESSISREEESLSQHVVVNLRRGMREWSSPASGISYYQLDAEGILEYRRRFRGFLEPLRKFVDQY